ncbi:hypothetical protein C8R42DRAFT_707082 [Lentinula raphanica]|nr:hypothetical protein C8R42DRAFT_707082 [Lentinula raphanica]
MWNYVEERMIYPILRRYKYRWLNEGIGYDYAVLNSHSPIDPIVRSSRASQVGKKRAFQQYQASSSLNANNQTIKNWVKDLVASISQLLGTRAKIGLYAIASTIASLYPWRVTDAVEGPVTTPETARGHSLAKFPKFRSKKKHLEAPPFHYVRQRAQWCSRIPPQI